MALDNEDEDDDEYESEGPLLILVLVLVLLLVLDKGVFKMPARELPAMQLAKRKLVL